jgi:hypothetical protein
LCEIIEVQAEPSDARQKREAGVFRLGPLSSLGKRMRATVTTCYMSTTDYVIQAHAYNIQHFDHFYNVFYFDYMYQEINELTSQIAASKQRATIDREEREKVTFLRRYKEVVNVFQDCFYIITPFITRR